MEKDSEKVRNDFLFDVLLKNQRAATKLWTMFNKDKDAIAATFKPGRKFWMFNEDKLEFELITITYVRSDVAFYIKQQDDIEEYIDTHSMAAAMLYPERIYIQEIINHLKNTGIPFKPNNIIEMYKRMPLSIPRDYIKITIDFAIKDEDIR